MCSEQIDNIIREDLRKILEYTYDDGFDVHPDDKAYRKKTRKHVKFVLEYYGGDPDEFE